MATFKGMVTVGLLLRGKFERALHEFCFNHDLELNVQKVSGMLETDFYFVGEGSAENCLKLKAWIEQLNSEFQNNEK